MVMDIRPGLEGSHPRSLTDAGGTLYFIANDGTHGDELWRSDGTEAGTFMVKDICAGSGVVPPSGSTARRCRGHPVLLQRRRPRRHGCELWKSDGTSAGTVMVKDISSLGSYPDDFTDVDGTLYFAAYDGIHGGELWKSDGTAAGTVLVKDIQPGTTCCGVGQRIGDLTNFVGTLYLSARDGAHGQELWKSDGTSAGTVLVKDVWPGRGKGSPFELTVLGRAFYFSADDHVHGDELWKSDGTAAGTVLVKDISLGPRWSYPFSLTGVRGTLYFVADTVVYGDELWKSDGTKVGTTIVKDIAPGSFDSIHSVSASHLVDVGGTLYFVADDGAHGQELWKSDGTDAGTIMVTDIWPGSEGSSTTQLVEVPGGLYFSAEDEGHGQELWGSDGTADGTFMVQDIWPGPASSTPRELVYIRD